jgi:glutaryl-CoA dehydrogenase
MNALPNPKPQEKPPSIAFDWTDPLLLNDELSDEERMIRDTANEYCQSKLLPRVIEAYREEKTDRSIFNEMGELGLLGVTIPRSMAASAHPTLPTASSPARWSGSTRATAR